MTVSNVLTNSSRVRASTRARVLEAIERLDHRVNVAGGRLNLRGPLGVTVVDPWEVALGAYDDEYTKYFAARVASLRRLGYLLSGDWHTADDLVQATFLKLLRHWRRIRNGQIDAYARRVPIGLVGPPWYELDASRYCSVATTLR